MSATCLDGVVSENVLCPKYLIRLPLVLNKSVLREEYSSKQSDAAEVQGSLN